jgi:hypothetical protein
LVSCSTVVAGFDEAATGGPGKKDGGGSGSANIRLEVSGGLEEREKRDEKDGGASGADAKASSEGGESGCNSAQGDSVPPQETDALNEILPETDEPSEESRVADNVRAVRFLIGLIYPSQSSC